MSAVTLSWDEFLQEAIEFQKISERLGDAWSFHKQDDKDGNAYLIYVKKMENHIDKHCNSDPLVESNYNIEVESAVASPPTNDLLEIEYHIVYSIAYQVPMLYFRIYRSDGSLMSLEDAWRIFHFYDGSTSNAFATGFRTNSDMLSIMTQMDHPVLQKPYIAMHPCRTAELLAQTGSSRNRVLTFISLLGPFVRLTLRNEYGVECDDI